jgi:hypothetical protein
MALMTPTFFFPKQTRLRHSASARIWRPSEERKGKSANPSLLWLDEKVCGGTGTFKNLPRTLTARDLYKELKKSVRAPFQKAIEAHVTFATSASAALDPTIRSVATNGRSGAAVRNSALMYVNALLIGPVVD